MEFFLIASGASDAPKRVQKLLATVTGFQVLPPFFSLGFHYCKWEATTTADRIMELNKNFEASNIPVDVFWMDIPYTDGSMYFKFGTEKFP
jgi:alpha 1,3-glucosidase